MPFIKNHFELDAVFLAVMTHKICGGRPERDHHSLIKSRLIWIPFVRLDELSWLFAALFYSYIFGNFV